MKGFNWRIALECSTVSLCLGMLLACGDSNTESAVVAPGEAKAPLTQALDVGADALQSRLPINELNAYLNGFHFYNGRMQDQMEAHHYCSILNEEVIQCAIFDGNMKDAKLMGVEYIISEQLFTTLPEQEKALWHSHAHEVKSGQLFAPGIPQPAEHALMEKLVGTYGKTWHTWHTDMDKQLPLGVPQLMMGFTADGQVDERRVSERDERFGSRSAERKAARADIVAPAVLPGADAWREGRVIQIQDPTVNQPHKPDSPGPKK
ncbi:OBAP family protein [Pseudomonas cichorii]|nr:OBAP family protein [Pseudomonas cichorii]